MAGNGWKNVGRGGPWGMIPGDTAYSGLYGEAPPERGALLARRSTI